MNVSDTCGVTAVCQALGLSESGVRRLANSGQLPFERDEHGRRRFAVRDVKRLARERQRKNNALIQSSR